MRHKLPKIDHARQRQRGFKVPAITLRTLYGNFLRDEKSRRNLNGRLLKNAYDGSNATFAEASHRLFECLLATGTLKGPGDAATTGQLTNHIDDRFLR